MKVKAVGLGQKWRGGRVLGSICQFVIGLTRWSHLPREAWRVLGQLAWVALMVVGVLGCPEKADDGTKPTSRQAELPALELRDITDNLMLTWVDDKGETHVELHPPDVPAEGRALVRIVVSDREEGTGDHFYVADLGQKRDDGTYAVRTMSRREWEGMIEKRRADYLAKIAPPPQVTATSTVQAAPAPGMAGVTVIIYGASWCKPCHQAADHVRAKGAIAIVKDIEQSADAAAEMREKLEKSNQRGGSIPIIDVRGQILVGYSPSALDRALAKAAAGTTL